MFLLNRLSPFCMKNEKGEGEEEEDAKKQFFFLPRAKGGLPPFFFGNFQTNFEAHFSKSLIPEC